MSSRTINVYSWSATLESERALAKASSAVPTPCWEFAIRQSTAIRSFRFICIQGRFPNQVYMIAPLLEARRVAYNGGDTRYEAATQQRAQPTNTAASQTC